MEFSSSLIESDGMIPVTLCQITPPTNLSLFLYVLPVSKRNRFKQLKVIECEHLKTIR